MTTLKTRYPAKPKALPPGPPIAPPVEVYREMLLVAANGFSLDVAADAVSDGVEALRAQAKALKAVDYQAWAVVDHPGCKACGCRGQHADRIAKAMQATSRMLDETTRLAAFCQGQPDSRPEVVATRDWLSKLTDQQLDTVQRWVAENERRGA